MKNSILNILKQKGSKILLVKPQIAEEITRMCRELNTNASDVLETALELLKLSTTNKIQISNGNKIINIPPMTNINSENTKDE